MESYILKRGGSSIEELSMQFGVSVSTIRRDVIELVKQRPFDKVFGGVSLQAGSLSGVPAAERLCCNAQGKQLIGKMAADLVADGMSIFLDSGSTTMQILPFLERKRNITVISHNLLVLYEAAKNPALNIIALGGVYDRNASAFASIGMIQELSRMSISLVFLETGGISIKRGMTSDNYAEAEIKKAIVKWNRNLVVVADHPKFGRDALLTFCGFDDVGTIVTDRTPPQEFVCECKSAEIQIISPETMRISGNPS